MAETPDVVVVGSLNMDLVVPVPAVPAPGETVLVGALRRSPGGKGANQAVAAARLGARVALVGRVGDDEDGRVLLRALGDEGVLAAGRVALAHAATGTALICVTPGGENTIVVAPGANGALDAAAVAEAGALIRGARVLLLQLEVPLESVAAAAGLAAEAGVRVVLNAAPAVPDLPADLLALADPLVVNEHEAAQVGREALAAARSSVVTAGEDGAYVLLRGERTHVPAVRVAEVVDTTGAGDTFVGALAAELARGADLLDAARLAVRAAALAVTAPGAQSAMPRRSDLQ
jgi:ribokinase